MTKTADGAGAGEGVEEQAGGAEREEGRGPRTEGRGAAAWIGVYLRGMAMGVAELIPGVSGGTIAFITGIYVELVRTIRSLSPQLAVEALRGRVAYAWREGNVGFLAVLGVGMVTSVVLFATLVGWLLVNREIHVWSFFFGLIVASAIYVGRYARPWTVRRILVAAVGVGAGTLLANVQPLPAPEHWISTVLAGAVAICAWILPGISGSFVLLLLGQYQQLVRALSEFDLGFLVALGAGCVAGLFAFARVLMWLLRVWYQGTLAFLCGFMAGSLQKLWPWREIVTSYVGSDGEVVPLVVRPLSPGAWEAMTGLDPMILGATASGVLAVVVVLGLGLLSRRSGGDGREGFGEPPARGGTAGGTAPASASARTDGDP